MWEEGGGGTSEKTKEKKKKNSRLDPLLRRAKLLDESLTRFNRCGIAHFLLLQTLSERNPPPFGRAPAVVDVTEVLRAGTAEGKAPEEEAYEANAEHRDDGSGGAWRHG